ncbi:MAG: hypothetical protein ACNA8P_10640, partial [Phycisphaerales bacterium]
MKSPLFHADSPRADPGAIAGFPSASAPRGNASAWGGDMDPANSANSNGSHDQEIDSAPVGKWDEKKVFT